MRVYIVKSGDYIKIGKATNISERIRCLLIGNPKPITLLFYGEFKTNAIAFHAETTLHRMLKHYHHRGEWFSYKGYALASGSLTSLVDTIAVDIVGGLVYNNKGEELVLADKYKPHLNKVSTTKGQLHFKCLIFENISLPEEMLDLLVEYCNLKYSVVS